MGYSELACSWTESMSCTVKTSADTFAAWRPRSRTVVDVDLLMDGVGLVELDILVVEEVFFVELLIGEEVEVLVVEEVFLVVLLIFVVVETFVELLIFVELV